MKTKHKYTDELEALLLQMDENEFFEWLKENEIEYKKSLLEVILNDKIKMEIEE